MPSSPEEWLAIEKGFKRFPHCVGAIDGKHIVVQCPAQTGSEYYNYKRTFSIVLLALVDSNFCFTFADIGSQGRISDGGVLRNSLLWQKMCSNQLNLPEPSPLPGSNIEAPFVFLADGAFALSTHILKPYPGTHELGSPKRMFNQKLSSTRVVVENVFGILASVFRIFRKPIALEVNKVSLITLTCVLLHNFLRRSKTSTKIYTPTGIVDILDDDGSTIQPGSWRQEVNGTCALRPLQNVPRRPTLLAIEVREKFKSYFCNV